MRRTTCLTMTALMGLGLLGAGPASLSAASASVSAAEAAGQKCRGEAATIVGSGRGIRGSEGRDVVMTNGAVRVNTFGGDDLVCVTGTRTGTYDTIIINSGPGDDVVDGSTSPRQAVEVDLGTGVDHFIGGDADDDIEAAPPSRDLAQGADTFNGGGGADSLSVHVSAVSSSINNTLGRISEEHTLRARLSGIEEFWIYSQETSRGDVDFVGNASDETVIDMFPAAGVSRFNFGAGDDAYLGGQEPGPGSTMGGGSGRDLFYVTSQSDVLDLDLARGSLLVGATSPYSIATTGFEDASLFASRVVLVGDNGPNELTLTACQGAVRGRKGADIIFRQYDSMFESSFGCAESLTADGGGGHDEIRGTRGDDDLRGGPGRDRIRGGFGSDLLIGGRGSDLLWGQAGHDVLKGGRGWDTADGGRGSDRCSAERTRRCEL